MRAITSFDPSIFSIPSVGQIQLPTQCESSQLLKPVAAVEKSLRNRLYLVVVEGPERQAGRRVSIGHTGGFLPEKKSFRMRISSLLQHDARGRAQRPKAGETGGDRRTPGSSIFDGLVCKMVALGRSHNLTLSPHRPTKETCTTFLGGRGGG